MRPLSHRALPSLRSRHSRSSRASEAAQKPVSPPASSSSKVRHFGPPPTVSTIACLRMIGSPRFMAPCRRHAGAYQTCLRSVRSAILAGAITLPLPLSSRTRTFSPAEPRQSDTSVDRAHVETGNALALLYFMAHLKRQAVSYGART
jgi:hypothetical protein